MKKKEEYWGWWDNKYSRWHDTGAEGVRFYPSRESAYHYFVERYDFPASGEWEIRPCYLPQPLPKKGRK